MSRDPADLEQQLEKLAFEVKLHRCILGALVFVVLVWLLWTLAPFLFQMFVLVLGLIGLGAVIVLLAGHGKPWADTIKTWWGRRKAATSASENSRIL